MYSMAVLVAIIMLVPVIALILLGAALIAGVNSLRGQPRRGDRAQRDQETELIQEIHQGFTKMEQRITSLETILLDPERKV